MKKALIAMESALTLAADTLALPTPASANPAWLVPALVAAGIGGMTVGAVAANAEPRQEVVVPPQQQPAYVAPGMQPAAACHWARARIDGAWQRIEICN